MESTVLVTHGKRDIRLMLAPDETLGSLKMKLHQLTRVHPKRLKLLGIPATVTDDTSLSTVTLKPKLMMMGTPDEEIERLVHEEAVCKEAQRAVVDDLDDLDSSILRAPVHVNADYVAKVAERAARYIPLKLGEPREGKKLLVLDVDYTLFDHRSPAESAAQDRKQRSSAS